MKIAKARQINMIADDIIKYANEIKHINKYEYSISQLNNISRYLIEIRNELEEAIPDSVSK